MRVISLFKLGISSPDEAFLLGLLTGVTRIGLSTPAQWGDRIAFLGTTAWDKDISDTGRTLQIDDEARSDKTRLSKMRSDKISSGEARSGQVRSGQVSSG